MQKIVGHKMTGDFFVLFLIMVTVQNEPSKCRTFRRCFLLVLMLCQEIVDTVGRVQQVADGTIMV